MNITNNYITLLRYTSAMNKKCGLSTLPKIGLKSFNPNNLKYCGPAEYKSLPITTPNSIKLLHGQNFYYDSFETSNLAAQKSLSSIHDSWFSIL